MSDGVGRRSAFPCAAAAGLLLLAAPILGALSGCSSPETAPTTASGTAIAVPGVRWWATPENPVGSTIAPGDVAAAASLPSDGAAYCAALVATEADGKSLFSADVDASTVGYQRTVHTFVAEITAMAPESVHDDWMVLGPVVDSIASAGSDPTSLALPTSVPTAAISAANASISAQAKRSCNVDFG